MLYPFGVTLIIYVLIYLFYTKRRTLSDVFGFLLILLVFLELFVNVGLFFRVGNYELLYDEIVLVLLLFVSIIIIFKHINTIRIRITMLLFIFSVSITKILLIVNPIEFEIFRNGEYIVPTFSIHSALVTLRVLIMLIISIVAVKFVDRTKVDELFEKLLKYVSVVYVIISLEWITKNAFNSNVFHIIVNYFFGIGKFTVDFLLERGRNYTIQGMTREPAHLSYGLFMFLILLIFSNVEPRKKGLYLFVGIFFIILSGSFSGLGFALVLVLTYLINSFKKLNRTNFIFALFILFLFVASSNLMVHQFSRLINILNILGLSNQTNLLTSEYVRLNTILVTLSTVFANRPMFGAGLAVPYAFSAIVMVISSIGIIGGFTWFADYFLSIGKVRTLKKIMSVVVVLVSLSFIGSINIIYRAYILYLAIQLRYHNCGHTTL